MPYDDPVVADNARHHANAPDRLSLLVPRIIWIDGHRTSVRLEPVIWNAFRKIAEHEGQTLNELASEIDRKRSTDNLTSAVRAYVVEYLLDRLDGLL